MREGMQVCVCVCLVSVQDGVNIVDWGGNPRWNVFGLNWHHMTQAMCQACVHVCNDVLICACSDKDMSSCLHVCASICSLYRKCIYLCV